MGGEQKTIKNRPVLGTYKLDNEMVIGIKGTVPGAYNSVTTLFIG
jgi:ribosomal protein L3